MPSGDHQFDRDTEEQHSCLSEATRSHLLEASLSFGKLTQAFDENNISEQSKKYKCMNFILHNVCMV